MAAIGNSRWDKGIQQMNMGSQKQESGDLVAAAKCYQFGIQMMIDHLKTLPSSDRKTMKQVKVESYMDMLEQVKQQIQINNPNQANKLSNRIVKPKPIRKSKPNIPKNNENRRNSGQNNRNYKTNSNNNNNNNKNKNKNTRQRSQSENEYHNKIINDIISSNLNVQFKDVIGLANVKQALVEAVILPSQRPDIFTGPRSPPNGILLFGPPGNGKTYIAKALASELGQNVTFFCISASSLTSRYVGDSEKMVKALFEAAREYSPSIIFIDEIDSILTSRGGDNEQESSRRMKTEFLVQMDGVSSGNSNENQVLLIGATNLPWQLDDAVLRRFERRIMVPLPDREQRKYVIMNRLKDGINYKLNNQEINMIIDKSNGYSCSDLKNLVQDASMGPIRELGMNIVKVKDVPPVVCKHFIDSLDNIKPSAGKKSLKEFTDWNDQFGSKLKIVNNNNSNEDIIMKSANNDDLKQQSKPNSQSNDSKTKSKWSFGIF